MRQQPVSARGEEPYCRLRFLPHCGFPRARAEEEWDGTAAVWATKTTGRPPEGGDRQGRQVSRWISAKNPGQYRTFFGSWTRVTDSERMQCSFRSHTGDTAVGRILQEMGITPHDPLRRQSERHPEANGRVNRPCAVEIARGLTHGGAKMSRTYETGFRSEQF